MGEGTKTCTANYAKKNRKGKGVLGKKVGRGRIFWEKKTRVGGSVKLLSKGFRKRVTDRRKRVLTRVAVESQVCGRPLVSHFLPDHSASRTKKNEGGRGLLTIEATAAWVKKTGA